jgi:cation diffusion facilitator CzcD-associated flavoprotein CzcO
MESRQEPLDVAIIGGGLAGVIACHYARRAGLAALVFERQAGVGGLWRELPAWQDIQISPADWALGDLPLAGALQPQILANIEAWVERFGLADRIRLNTPVQRVRQEGTGWAFDTPQATVHSRHLIAATGGHNRPIIPPVQRDASEVRELHSSALRDPAEVAGRDVVVVGGGASAFDLLDLCLEHGARRIAWVYRGLRWFTPTGKPKHIAGSVRGFARLQASGMTPQQQSDAIRGEMLARYDKFGLHDIQPQQAFDVLHDQLIPGRNRMLANYARIERFRGSVERIAGRDVTLTSGEQVAADLLLWGTGYALDLSYFESPAIASIRDVEVLATRCGGLVRSLDADNLYFPGVGLNGIGSGPWAYSLLCRTIMSHIEGTANLDLATIPHKVNHFDLVDYLAARDPASYPEGWREQYRRIALETPDDQPYPIP